MKACPFCAEEIQDAAKKCKHCGEFLEDSAAPLAPHPVPAPNSPPGQSGSRTVNPNNELIPVMSQPLAAQLGTLPIHDPKRTGEMGAAAGAVGGFTIGSFSMMLSNPNPSYVQIFFGGILLAAILAPIGYLFQSFWTKGVNHISASVNHMNKEPVLSSYRAECPHCAQSVSLQCDVRDSVMKNGRPISCKSCHRMYSVNEAGTNLVISSME